MYESRVWMHKLEAQDNNFVTCQKPKEDRLDLLHINLHCGGISTVAQCSIWPILILFYYRKYFCCKFGSYLLFFHCESWQSKNRPSILCRYVLPTSIAAIANSWHALSNSSQKKKSDFFFKEIKLVDCESNCWNRNDSLWHLVAFLNSRLECKSYAKQQQIFTPLLSSI